MSTEDQSGVRITGTHHRSLAVHSQHYLQFLPPTPSSSARSSVFQTLLPLSLSTAIRHIPQTQSSVPFLQPGISILICQSSFPLGCTFLTISLRSTVRRSSTIVIQIFDQKRFKKRDQGFLGLVRLGGDEVLAFSANGHGNFLTPFLIPLLTINPTRTHQ